MSGRRTILNDAVIEAAADLVRAGHFDVAVYEGLGIAKATFYSWLKNGEDLQEALDNLSILEEDLTEFAKLQIDFTDRIKKARLESQNELVNLIKSAAKKPHNWTAAAWILERRYSETWGTKEQKESDTKAKALDKFLARMELLAEEDEE